MTLKNFLLYLKLEKENAKKEKSESSLCLIYFDHPVSVSEDEFEEYSPVHSDPDHRPGRLDGDVLPVLRSVSLSSMSAEIHDLGGHGGSPPQPDAVREAGMYTTVHSLYTLLYTKPVYRCVASAAASGATWRPTWSRSTGMRTCVTSVASPG